MSETKPPFLKRVRIENFKSIRHCDVELQPLTLLVGPNGSGKTNFLDALRLVSEILKRPRDEVIRLLGGTVGLSEVPLFFRQTPMSGMTRENDPGAPRENHFESFRRAANLAPAAFYIQLEMSLSSDVNAQLTLELTPPFEIAYEQCVITDQDRVSFGLVRIFVSDEQGT